MSFLFRVPHIFIHFSRWFHRRDAAALEVRSDSSCPSAVLVCQVRSGSNYRNSSGLATNTVPEKTAARVTYWNLGIVTATLHNLYSSCEPRYKDNGIVLYTRKCHQYRICIIITRTTCMTFPYVYGITMTLKSMWGRRWLSRLNARSVVLRIVGSSLNSSRLSVQAPVT